MLKQPRKKPQMLLVLGGLRIGDTFHIIPFLKRACEKYHVHWIHGKYATHAVEFIRDHIVGMDISSEVRPEMKSLPGGYPDVKEFATLNIQDVDESAYDVIVPTLNKIDVWFPELVCPNMINTRFNIAGVEFDRKTDALCTLKEIPANQDHVVVQATTVSSWKCSDSLYALNPDIFEERKVYSVGAVNERSIVGANVIVKNGCSFKEVAELLVASRFVITLHSAVACLAYHLGVPTICVSFGKGFFPFHVGRPNNVELVQPPRHKLLEVVKSYIADKRPHITEDML